MTGFDMTESIAPNSAQLNAEDLLTGPRTFTIAEVKHGNGDQPFDFHLVEFPGRPFRPSKTVRRILVSAWGSDAATYAGKRMTLYRDPAVKFGGMDVGGIRVSHLSHIQKPLSLALAVSKGKRAMYVVKPLVEPAEKPAAVRSVSSGQPDNGATQEQLKALADGMTGIGLTEREDKLAYLSGALGREIGSAKDVTRDEADKLLAELAAEASE